MLKVGLIGCGGMGTMHANCYKNLEGVELVALADQSRKRLRHWRPVQMRRSMPAVRSCWSRPRWM